jgi:membrane-bound serine protease (ClpP class)
MPAPDPLWLIVTLTALGIVLLAVELFVPGMVVGIIGATLLLIAVVLTFLNFGLAVGALLVMALVVLGVVAFTLWLRFLPRSYIGRKMSLDAASRTSVPDFTALLGGEGEALTQLRPSGTAAIGGRRVDVTTDGEFIGPGEPVRVSHVEGTRVVVRKR